jgi:D-alanyl-D-alanine carboxypeptidase
MRHKLWLFSAFTVAATLTLSTAHAEAVPQKSSKAPVTLTKPAKDKKVSPQPQTVSIDAAYRINTKDCPSATFTPADDKYTSWGWKGAKLTAVFTQQDDGSYKVTELPGAKNPDEKLPIASIAKMMTALVIFDQVDQKKFTLDRKIPVTQESLCLKKTDNYFAVKGLPAGITEIEAEHAMGQMIRKSSNTMAVNFATAVSGNVTDFVALMNAKAKEWGMSDTHFERPDGLPVKDRKLEHTTARDLVIMAKHVLPYMERLKKYETEPLKTWTITEGTDKRKEQLNKLGAVFKTGTIWECASLLTIAEQGDYVAKQGRHVVVNVQLCDTIPTRFPNAFAALNTGLQYIGNMGIPSAMAATEPPAVPTLTAKTKKRPKQAPIMNVGFEPVSSPPAPPSEP